MHNAMRKLGLLGTLLVLIVAPAPRTIRADEPKPIAGTYANGELTALAIEGRRAYWIKPTKKVDPDKRWICVGPFWLAVEDDKGMVQHRMYVERFLDAGFHVAGVDVGISCGSPRGAEVYQKLYEHLTTQLGLNRRVRLLGQSNGGLISYAWAFRHPESVEKIGGIYPATDFRSWPGLANVINFPEPPLGYGLTLEELTARAAEFNPIDNLAPLAKAGVKIFHIHGDKDELVPAAANSVALVEKYKQLGGDASLETLPGLGHGGKEFYESESLVKFLLD